MLQPEMVKLDYTNPAVSESSHGCVNIWCNSALVIGRSTWPTMAAHLVTRPCEFRNRLCSITIGTCQGRACATAKGTSWPCTRTRSAYPAIVSKMMRCSGRSIRRGSSSSGILSHVSKWAAALRVAKSPPGPMSNKAKLSYSSLFSMVQQPLAPRSSRKRPCEWDRQPS